MSDTVLHFFTKERQVLKYILYLTAFLGVLTYTGVLALQSLWVKTPEVVAQVNDFRASLGVKALKTDFRLDCAAQSHSYDMFLRSSCTHTTRMGQGVRWLAQECGYPWTSGELIVICKNFHADMLAEILVSFYKDEVTRYNFVGYSQHDQFHAFIFAD